MTKTFFRLCAVALLAAPLVHSVAQTPNAPVASKAEARAATPASNYGSLSLNFEPNRGQAESAVQFLARGSQYTVLLQPTVATLVLSREDAASGIRHTGRPAPVTRTAIRMTLDGANPHAAMSPDRSLPGYVNYITGDKSKTFTGIPTYAGTRAASVYPGIDLVYYGTGRQLEYDFVVSPKSDPNLIHLAIDGARPIVESNGDLRLQIGTTRRDTDIVFHKPILYQQINGARQSIDGAFMVAANNKVGFKTGTYDHSKELVIDPVIGYGSYFGGNGEDEINGSALNSANQLYVVGQTLSAVLPSVSGEFQSVGNGGNGGHDAFVTKFSADGSTVLWTTFLEGSTDDVASGVAVNSSDQAYVVGNTYSCLNPGEFNNTPSNAVRFPFTSDAIQPLCNGGYNQPETGESDGGNSDAFLVKLSSDGKTELYGTPLGGSQNDYASSIVLDATGRPYIVGETNSTQYYKCATVGPHCNDIPSYPVDNHGNANIGPTNYPTTPNAAYSNVAESIQYSTTDGSGNTGGPQDEQAFITILSADLHSFVYSSLIGGEILGNCGNGACATNGYAVAVNANGIAFIGGNTSSAHWPTTAGSFSPTCSNAGAANSTCPLNGWLAAFDPTKSGAASLLFSTYMDGTSAGADNNGNPLYPGGDVYGLAIDSKGNVVATGDTNANNFPTTSGTFQPVCTQFGDGNGNTKRCTGAFVTKLSPTGATVWSTYFSPPTQPGNAVIGNSIALDANDNVFVAGTSTSPTLPLIHPISTNPGQYSDALVFELSPTGSTELMGTYIGAIGISVDNNSLHLDSNLNAYFSGSIQYSTNGIESFPATPGGFSSTGLGGSADGWIMKLITQQQTSATALQITPNAGGPGTSIGFTAMVMGITGFATPTGTVTLTNGSTTLGTITLANGTGTFNTTTLAVGTYSVIATYSGDVVYASSTTTAQTVTIQNTPTIALTATPSTAAIGTAIALKATVASSAGTPTGTVFFMDGTNTLGSAVLISGVSSYSATALAVGSHSITARYSGDSNFVAINSTAQSVTINLLTPAVALTATPATAQVGTAIALAATVTGTGATPTGTVKFLDGSSVLNTFTLTGTSGVASYSAASLAVGIHSIAAVYSGDANFASVTSAPQTVTINAIPATVSLAANPSSLTIKSGATGTTVITVTPAGGYTGTLTFSCGTLPTSASCNFSPATLVFTGGATAQTSTLTISTTSTHAMLNFPLDHELPVAAFAGLLLLPLALRRRAKLKSYWSMLPMLALAGLFAMLAVSGCSSPGNSATNTPTGSYTVPVTVNGGTASNNLNLQVTVQ